MRGASAGPIKKSLWAWFGETEYERCKLFNMPVPEGTVKMAEQIGVPLELPPCQQQQVPRKGESSEASFQSARNSPSKPAQ